MSDSTEKILSEVLLQQEDQQQETADVTSDGTQPPHGENDTNSQAVPLKVTSLEGDVEQNQNEEQLSDPNEGSEMTAHQEASSETEAGDSVPMEEAKNGIGNDNASSETLEAQNLREDPASESETETLHLSDEQTVPQEVQVEAVSAESVPDSQTETKRDDELDNEAIRELVSQCLQADLQASQQERADADQTRTQLKVWAERQWQLSAAVLRLRDVFNSRMAECNAREQALPHEATAALTSRREGIELCGRMLERLTSRLMNESAFDVPEQVDMLPPLQAEEINTLLQKDPSSPVEAFSTQILKERRIHNHKALADVRKQAETVQKKFMTTVERQLLPILDGLDEGKKVGIATLEDLSKRFADHTTELHSWFAIYDELISVALTELSVVHIQPMSINRGDPVDYERHEPVDVEEDPELTDEGVKEVIRRGYTILDTDSETQRVLRSGKVVVVKNHKAE